MFVFGNSAPSGGGTLYFYGHIQTEIKFGKIVKFRDFASRYGVNFKIPFVIGSRVGGCCEYFWTHLRLVYGRVRKCLGDVTEVSGGLTELRVLIADQGISADGMTAKMGDRCAE